jgi:hypothetical protein
MLRHISEKSLVDGVGLLVKTSEEYRLEVTAKRSRRSDGNRRCKFFWKSVNTRADGWKSDSLYAESVGNFQRPTVTGREQFLFGAIQVPWSPDRTDCMDYILRWQAIGFGCLGIARLTAIQGHALLLQPFTCCPVDCAIDASATHQRILRRINDCIDIQLGDVARMALSMARPQILADA